jgi:hypothetical protein
MQAVVDATLVEEMHGQAQGEKLPQFPLEEPSVQFVPFRVAQAFFLM